MDVGANELLAAAGLRRGSRFCVVGCPPCQSFSKLADTRGVGAARDPRSRLVSKFAALVTEMRRAAAVFENVSWMASGPGRAFSDECPAMMEEAGYRTAHGVVNASLAGIPQNRKRIIAVSVKKRLLNARRARLLDAFHGMGGEEAAPSATHCRACRRCGRGRGHGGIRCTLPASTGIGLPRSYGTCLRTGGAGKTYRAACGWIATRGWAAAR